MLTKKAVLNASASFLDYGARVAVVMVTTPILIHTLGASLFGAWQMLARMGDHLAPADGRSAVAFRWLIVDKQEDPEGHAKRRVLASALIIWIGFLPLFIALGAALVLLSPWITNVAAEHDTAVRLAMALVVVSTLCATLKMFPGGVLFAQNLAHKNMGVMAGTTIVGGVLIVIALYMGLGLPGVAGATLIGAALGAYVSFVVARHHVAWLGVERPTRREVETTLRLSAWYIAWTFVENLLVGADIMMLGYLASSGLVARYVVTAYGVQTVTMIMLTAIAAAMPGLGSIISRRDLVKARSIRNETITYTWLIGMVIGATVLLCNASFVRIWIGEAQYAGDLENLLIVMVTMQLVLIRVDAAVINLALDMRNKVLLGAGAAVLSLALSVPLIPQFGIVGLCVALMTGRIVLTVAYPRIVHDFLSDDAKGQWRRWIRVICAALLLLTVAALIGPHLVVASWAGLLAVASVSVIGSAGMAYWVALNTGQRRMLADRFRSVIRS
jgi:O-antigen/teichoic acid export membrane protein